MDLEVGRYGDEKQKIEEENPHSIASDQWHHLIGLFVYLYPVLTLSDFGSRKFISSLLVGSESQAYLVSQGYSTSRKAIYGYT
jgi:hypothetical protein